MKKSKDYTADSIEVLTDVQHVRARTNLYLGNMTAYEYTVPFFLENKFQIKKIQFTPSVYKAVGEVIDNSLDEFAQITQKNKELSIKADCVSGSYSISDNGRGVPIDKYKDTNKYTPEIVFGSLRSGRNFSDDKTAGVIGTNGVGSSVVAMTSTEFKVTIYRDKKRYIQTFLNGTSKVSKPKITAIASRKNGTEVSFTLDREVFKDTTLPDELLHNRAIEIALTNPDIAVNYNGNKYRFKKGLEDYVKTISNNSYFKFTFEQGEFYVVFDTFDGIDEQVFTWVNSSLLFDSGICNTQFLNAFFDKAVDHLAAQAKKAKIEVTKNDVRQGLLVLGNLKIPNPEYDAQSKTRLTGPNLRKEIVDMLTNQWTQFARKNKTWLNSVLERAVSRHHLVADKKAIKEHQKSLNKKVPKLTDATSTNRFNCQILITEGDSAKSKITEARDPVTTAAFPLTGKINNVYGVTPAQLLQMKKLTNLLMAIGLTPGKKALRSELRYGKIVIATDADYDGSDIFTLLINLFYTFWPELFDTNYEPMVYRLVAPNVVVSKGKQRIHFTTRTDYEKQKSKYKNWTVEYMKGLGSMSKKDWEMILSGKTNTLIPIVDDDQFKQTLELLFGPDSDARKTWLQE